MTELVRATGLTIALGGCSILKQADLSLAVGQHSLLLGPSGSGKTTLLRILAGLVAPDAGELLFGGRSLAEHGCPRNFRLKTIGLVFQDVHLLESMTLRQNIEMVRSIAKPPAERLFSASDLLEPLGLGGRLDERVVHLSRGERQRVGLARAFANGPRLLLADEPTASLDVALRDQTLNHLFALAARCGTTVLVASHDVALRDRQEFTQVLELSGGQLVCT